MTQGERSQETTDPLEKNGGPDTDEDRAERTDAEFAVEGEPSEDQATSSGPGGSETLGCEEVEELRKKAKERDQFLDELLRAKADLDNFRKRIERDRPRWEIHAVGRFLRDLLPVVDNFERAVESFSAESSDAASVREGVEMIYQQLKQMLESHGVEEVEAEGTQFDPDRHEALQEIPVTDRETGEIVDVHQRGYRYRGFLVRPSKVLVARKLEDSGGQQESDEET